MPILNIDTTKVVDRHFDGNDVLQAVVDAIYAEAATYPSVYPNDTSRYIFAEVPLTVLDPTSIPAEPEFVEGATPEEIHERYQAWYRPMLEFWGSDELDALTMYGQDFDLPGKPFTVWGYWTDDGGAGGLFGQSKGDPTIKVLFC